MSDFQTARFVVVIHHRPDDGAMMSAHHVASPEDTQVVADWASGGLVQVSNALVVEYLRQESYVMALTLLSQGKVPDDLTVEDLLGRVRAQVLHMVDAVGTGAVQEAIDRIKSSTVH
jgi:predicted P-loop ATPase/GTPase